MTAPGGRPLRPSGVFVAILVFRLVNALALRTFFQPDEYFQALEPAWQLAFGPGAGAWVTWEWHHAIRSSLHPTLFALAYRAADALSDTLPALRPMALLVAPKLLQAVFAAGSDWGTWRLAGRIYGDASPASYAAAVLTLASPWQWYCSTRTFSNSLETTLTALALAFFPWPLLSSSSSSSSNTPTKENPKPPPLTLSLPHLRLSLLLAALAIVIRPTNIFIWAPIAILTILHISSSPSPARLILPLAREAILCGAAVLALSSGADRVYFGRWTSTQHNWLHFNLFQSLSLFYGVNGWHYYLTQALPILCAAALPFVLIALWRPALGGPAAAAAAAGLGVQKRNALRVLTAAVYTTIAVLSLIAHKEWRFIYPLLPILHVLAAPSAAAFFLKPAPPTTTPPKRPAFFSSTLRLRHTKFLINALSINAAMAIFLSLLHQPATISVLTFLRDQYAHQNPHLAALSPSSPLHLPPSTQGDDDRLFALFLTPCHATPWRSHLLYPGLRARMLTCSPPLHTTPGSREREEYQSEDEIFYNDPQAFLGRELLRPAGEARVPRYIVGFQGVEPWLREFFERGEGRALGVVLEKAWVGWNGFFSDDERKEGRLIVWSTSRSTAPQP